MRHVSFGLFIMAMLLAAACTGTAQEGPEIGVVDINRVFQESQAGKQGMEYLQGINQQFQQEFSEMQAQAQEGEQNATDQQMQEAVSRYQARIGQEQQRIVGILNEKFQELLEEYRQDNNLSVIISSESVLTMSESVDVTDQLIERFDEAEIDLESQMEEPQQDGAMMPETEQNPDEGSE